MAGRWIRFGFGSAEVDVWMSWSCSGNGQITFEALRQALHATRLPSRQLGSSAFLFEHDLPEGRSGCGPYASIATTERKTVSSIRSGWR